MPVFRGTLLALGPAVALTWRQVIGPLLPLPRTPAAWVSAALASLSMHRGQCCLLGHPHRALQLTENYYVLSTHHASGVGAGTVPLQIKEKGLREGRGQR